MIGINRAKLSANLRTVRASAAVSQKKDLTIQKAQPETQKHMMAHMREAGDLGFFHRTKMPRRAARIQARRVVAVYA